MKSFHILFLLVLYSCGSMEENEPSQHIEAMPTTSIHDKGSYNVSHPTFYHLLENNDTIYSYPYLSDWKTQHPTDPTVFLYKEDGAKVFYPLKSNYYYDHTSPRQNKEYKKMQLAVAPVQPIDSIVANYVYPIVLKAGSRGIGSFAVPEIANIYHFEHDLRFNLQRPQTTKFEAKIYEFSNANGLQSAALVVLETHLYKEQSSWAISVHGMEAPTASYPSVLQEFLKSHREITLGFRAIFEQNKEFIWARAQNDRYHTVYYTPKQEYERQAWLSREKLRTLTDRHQRYDDYYSKLQSKNWSAGDFEDDRSPIPPFDSEKHGYSTYSNWN